MGFFAATAVDVGEIDQKYGALLLEDERKFIDLANSPLWWAQERPVIE